MTQRQVRVDKNIYYVIDIISKKRNVTRKQFLEEAVKEKVNNEKEQIIIE